MSFIHDIGIFKKYPANCAEKYSHFGSKEFKLNTFFFWWKYCVGDKISLSQNFAAKFEHLGSSGIDQTFPLY